MKVGIVCPYSWDIPGGVQNHIRDFTEELHKRGHNVSVLAPGDEKDTTNAPAYVVKAGKPVSVPYNGSVARVLFGPRTAARVRKWLADGQFDVVHAHEPNAVSVSLLAAWLSDAPIVGTFHAQMRSRMLSAAHGLLQSAMEKISARIAVSEAARQTIVEHMGGDCVVIPNGIFVDSFAVQPNPDWASPGGTLSFLGRLGEQRKGLPVLLEAWNDIHAAVPDARLLVAGRGETTALARKIPPSHRDSVTFLGGVSDHDKAVMLASSDIYVAPHTGGESFGIVIAEAMAAGAPVLASNLEAFRPVLDDGRLGALVPTGDADALAKQAVTMLQDRELRESYRSAASLAVRRYDWQHVADEVLEVYDMAVRVGMPGHKRLRGGLTS